MHANQQVTRASEGCLIRCSGDVTPLHDVAQLQADFREQHAGVFEALQRSMDVASTSGEPVPECIQMVSHMPPVG